MSILYLRITENWADTHDQLTGESTSDLFMSLRQWRTLILDRDRLQTSRRHTSTSSRNTTLDLELYNRFLSNIADIFMFEYLSDWPLKILVLNTLLGNGVLFLFVIRMFTKNQGVQVYDLARIALAIASIFIVVVYRLSGNLSHAVRRPRRRYLRHNPEIWPEESSAQNTVLAAIWGRQCKEPKDFNFGTRNLMQLLTRTELTHLDYSSSLGEVFRDLTVNLLQLTHSPELVLAALRSSMPGAPSWTVDWSMRAPLRLYPGNFERYHGLCYDLTARPAPQDSWRFDPLRPNVLQVRAWMLGTVTAVLDFEKLEDNSTHDKHAAHIHNLEALLRLANVELDSKDWRGIALSLPELSGPALKFFRRNRHLQPDEILSLLQSHGSCRTISYLQDHGLSLSLTNASLFRSYEIFCNTMASKHDKQIVLVDGARPPESDISVSHWPSNVCMATCYPVSAASGSSHASLAVHDRAPDTQYQVCRVQPGDGVLQLCGLREKAVVRQDGDKLVFVDAIEAMGLPILVSEWTNACDPREMPLVDIS